MIRDCRQYRRRPETADSTGDDQRLWTVQEKTRDCRQYRRRPETAYSTGNDQRLLTIQDCQHIWKLRKCPRVRGQ
ncbi:unnamed protein product, partial [Staurois parvus]